jgi:hypothetical protein
MKNLKMMLLVFIGMCQLKAFSQNKYWFNTNTQITYNYKEPMDGKNGFLLVKSLNDTIVNNLQFQRLASEINNWNGTKTLFKTMLLTTDTVNNRVLFLDSNKVYTLYDFSKKLGDTIFIKAPFFMSMNQDSGCYVIIDSVNSKVINGRTLKTMHYKNLKMLPKNMFNWNFSGEVIEKIGNTSSPYPRFCEECDGPYIDGLRCFQNDDLNLKAVDFDCDKLFTNVQKTNFTKIELNIFPNPFIDAINIEGTDFNTNISLQYKIINYQSVTVKEGQLKSSIITTNELPSGIYLLTVTSENQKILISKILKL